MEAILIEDNDGQPDLQTNGASALYTATELEVTKSILENDVPVYVQAVDGLSALHVSNQNGNVEVAKLLLENGEQVDVLDNDQCSPL